MNVKKINYNEDYCDGCETCDYGSQYINDLEIIFEDDTKTHIVIDNMYEFAFTEADLMQLLYTSTSIEDFILSSIGKFVHVYINSYTTMTPSECAISSHLSNLDITYNDKSVDVKATYFYNTIKFKGDSEVSWDTFVKKSKDASPAAIKSYAEDYAYDVAEYGSPAFEKAFNKALNYANKPEFKPIIINEVNYIDESQMILPWQGGE